MGYLRQAKHALTTADPVERLRLNCCFKVGTRVFLPTSSVKRTNAPSPAAFNRLGIHRRVLGFRFLQIRSLKFRTESSKYSDVTSICFLLDITFRCQRCMSTTVIPTRVVMRRKNASLVGQHRSRARMACRCLLCSSIKGRNRNKNSASFGCLISLLFTPPNSSSFFL